MKKPDFKKALNEMLSKPTSDKTQAAMDRLLDNVFAGEKNKPKALIHLIKIDNQINIPTDFQQKCRLSVGLLFPKCITQTMMGTLDV